MSLATQPLRVRHAKTLTVLSAPVALFAVLGRMPTLATLAFGFLVVAFLLSPQSASRVLKDGIQNIGILAILLLVLGVLALGLVLFAGGAAAFSAWHLALGTLFGLTGAKLTHVTLRALLIPSSVKPRAQAALPPARREPPYPPKTLSPPVMRPVAPAAPQPVVIVARTVRPIPEPRRPPATSSVFVNSQTSGINVQGNQDCKIEIAHEQPATPAPQQAVAVVRALDSLPGNGAFNAATHGINIQGNDNCTIKITCIQQPRSQRPK